MRCALMMSALGHKRTFRSAIGMSTLPRKRTLKGLVKMSAKSACLSSVSALNGSPDGTAIDALDWLKQSLWTIRLCEQFCTDFSFEFKETGWFETSKPSAQCFNFINIC
jgi:hypothetical protein